MDTPGDRQTSKGAAHLQFAVIQARQRHILHFHLQLLAEKSHRTLIARDTGGWGHEGVSLAPQPPPADPSPTLFPAKIPLHTLACPRDVLWESPRERVPGLNPPAVKWGGGLGVSQLGMIPRSLAWTPPG